jgi:hypothetical protein
MRNDFPTDHTPKLLFIPRTIGNELLPLAAPLGRSERRVAAASYVSGLLMPGQRKSIEPMAARLGVDAQRIRKTQSATAETNHYLAGVTVIAHVVSVSTKFKSLTKL